MEEELPRPRYYKEANGQFLLPGGYSLQGMPLGMVLIVIGMGLGYWWLIPVGIGLSFYLGKRVGDDENYLKSLFWHLLTYKGMRYIVASPQEPQPKVTVVTKAGETLQVSEWLQRRIKEKQRGDGKR
jgi:hypothetical protein